MFINLKTFVIQHGNFVYSLYSNEPNFDTATKTSDMLHI